MRRRPTVLLVEDDDALRLLYKTALAQAGCDVVEASSGLTALRYLETSRPDAIVLDLIMPGISGFDVRAEVRASTRLRDVPVIVVTAIPRDGLTGYDARYILTKPILPLDLVKTVQRCLGAPPGAGTP